MWLIDLTDDSGKVAVLLFEVDHRRHCRNVHISGLQTANTSSGIVDPDVAHDPRHLAVKVASFSLGSRVTDGQNTFLKHTYQYSVHKC